MKFYIRVEVCQPTTSGTNPHCLLHLKEIILNTGKLAITERKQEKRIRLHETRREGYLVEMGMLVQMQLHPIPPKWTPPSPFNCPMTANAQGSLSLEERFTWGSLALWNKRLAATLPHGSLLLTNYSSHASQLTIPRGKLEANPHRITKIFPGWF